MNHGGITDELRARLGPEPILDVSANVNPYGPAPAVLAAIREADLGDYPDPRGQSARAALARSIDVDPAELIVGAGAVDLLWAAVRAHCGPDRPLLVAEPTFSEARAAAAACGAPVVEWRARPESDFAWDLDELAAALAQARPAAAYLCTPQNPTGVGLPAADLASLVREFADTVFVVDQSFLALSTRWGDERLRLPDNAVALRSLTKTHALPGLRLGYARCVPALVRALDGQRPPWSVSAPALAAFEVIARTPGLAVDARARMLADARDLVCVLADAGFRATPTDTVYALVDLGRPAAPVVEQLLAKRRILVRDATSFGLPSRVRLAARPRDQVRAVVGALADA